MHFLRKNSISHHAIVTVSSPSIRSGVISALRYEQDYFFLTTYNHGKAPEKKGNCKMRVAG